MPIVLALAMLADDVYSDDAASGAVAGFRRIPPSFRMNSANQRESSFYGAAYSNGRIGVIAYRGSKEARDWYDADVDIGIGRFPIDQLGDAYDFFNSAKNLLVESHGCERLVVTGHSLGGGLTQIVAASIASVPVVGVTFNAPGVAGLTGPVNIPCKNEGNIFNYRARHDPVSLKGAHIGKYPVCIDVNVGLAGLATQAILGTVASVVAGPLVGVGVGMATGALLEHKMGPLVAALQTSPIGVVRH